MIVRPRSQRTHSTLRCTAPKSTDMTEVTCAQRYAESPKNGCTLYSSFDLELCSLMTRRAEHLSHKRRRARREGMLAPVWTPCKSLKLFGLAVLSRMLQWERCRLVVPRALPIGIPQTKRKTHTVLTPRFEHISERGRARYKGIGARPLLCKFWSCLLESSSCSLL